MTLPGRLPRSRCGAGVIADRMKVAVLGMVLILGLAACGQPAARVAQASPSPACPSETSGALPLISDRGLNYGTPPGPDGEYLGLTWLRSDMGSDDNWSQAQRGLQATLPFIQQQHLGQVLRVFVGLDQIMLWKEGRFQGLDPAGVDHFRTALQMFRSSGLQVDVVLFDQEQQSTAGNFRYWALDGRHPQLRAGYLEATRDFVSMFGDDPTIAAWDLFNEAYNSLSPDGGLPTPPAPDPVTAGFSERVVHQWMHDLYDTAKCAAPAAWFTFSDATALDSHHPDPGLYSGCVDFYDIHVYQAHPYLPDWKAVLKKPFILGEVGSPRTGGSVNQGENARVVRYWLSHAAGAGVAAVLVQDEKGTVYAPDLTRLTPTGVALSSAR